MDFPVRHQHFSLKDKTWWLAMQARGENRSVAGMLFLPQKSFAFRGIVYAVWWVTLPFLEWFAFVAVMVVFHGNCCCHTSGIWWNGSQIPGVCTEPEHSSSPHPAKDVEKHWAEGVVALAWWPWHGDEVWFAMAYFLGVSSGLLQKLAGLQMLYPETPPLPGEEASIRERGMLGKNISDLSRHQY